MLGVVMAGVALIVTACATTAGANGGEVGAIETGAGSDAGTGGSLVGKSYLSLTVTEDGEAKALVPDTRIRLDFRDDGVLSANAGCNWQGGYISTDGGKLSIDGIGGTEMSCGPAGDAQEKWLERLLLDKPTWKLEGDLLTITRGSTTMVLHHQGRADHGLDRVQRVPGDGDPSRRQPDRRRAQNHPQGLHGWRRRARTGLAVQVEGRADLLHRLQPPGTPHPGRHRRHQPDHDEVGVIH